MEVEVALIVILIGLGARAAYLLRKERASRRLIQRRLDEIANLGVARRLSLLRFGRL